MLVSNGADSSSVYAPYEFDGIANYAVEAEIQLLPTSGRTGFGVFARSTDAGSIWLLTGFNDRPHPDFPDEIEGSRIGVADEVITQQEYDIDNEWHTYRLEVNGNQILGLVDGAIVLVAQDNRLLDPGFAGLFVDEGTQINVRSFRIISLGDGSASSASTTPPTAQVATSAQADGTASIESTTSNAGDAAVSSGNFSGDLTLVLPTEADVPDHLIVVGGASRTLDEVAANYTNPSETTALFQQWGWQENVTRAFNMPSGVPQPPGEVEGVYVSIHRFSTPEGARLALDFSVGEQMVGTSLYEIQITPMGDYSRALYGPVSYGTEITFLVQKGNLLIRLSVSSRDSDPTVDGTGVMNAILAKFP